MENQRSSKPDVIRRETVRVVEQPAMLGCGEDSVGSTTPMAVVPLMDGELSGVLHFGSDLSGFLFVVDDSGRTASSGSWLR